MEADLVQTFSGRTVSHPDVGWKGFIEALSEIVHYAADRRIRIALELSGELLCGKPEEAMEALEAAMQDVLSSGTEPQEALKAQENRMFQESHRSDEASTSASDGEKESQHTQKAHP